jgi:hypothetical protein
MLARDKHSFKFRHKLSDRRVKSSIKFRPDVGVVAVGLDLEEPRQGVERGRQQDRDDEGARPDPVLEPEERATHHDVAEKKDLRNV